MKNKHLIISFLLLFLSFMLVACTDEKTDEKATTDEGNETTGEKAPVAQVDPFDHSEKYTITGMTFRFGDPPPLKSPGLDMINERFNVDYKPEIIPQGDYVEKSSAIVASGAMPDLVGFQAGDTRFYQWAEDGAFLPLDDYLSHYETLGNIPDYIYNSFKVH